MLLPECSLQPLLAPPSHLPSLRVLQICNCQHPHLPKSLAGCRCTPAPGTLEGSTLLPSFGPTSPGLGLLEVWAWLPVKETNRSPLAHPPSSVPSRSPALQRALQGPSQASCPAGGGGGGGVRARACLQSPKGACWGTRSIFNSPSSSQPPAQGHRTHEAPQCLWDEEESLSPFPEPPCHQVSSPVPPALGWEFWVTLPTLNKCAPLSYCLRKTHHLAIPLPPPSCLCMIAQVPSETPSGRENITEPCPV